MSRIHWRLPAVSPSRGRIPRLVQGDRLGTETSISFLSAGRALLAVAGTRAIETRFLERVGVEARDDRDPPQWSPRSTKSRPPATHAPPRCRRRWGRGRLRVTTSQASKRRAPQRGQQVAILRSRRETTERSAAAGRRGWCGRGLAPPSASAAIQNASFASRNSTRRPSAIIARHDVVGIVFGEESLDLYPPRPGLGSSGGEFALEHLPSTDAAPRPCCGRCGTPPLAEPDVLRSGSTTRRLSELARRRNPQLRWCAATCARSVPGRLLPGVVNFFTSFDTSSAKRERGVVADIERVLESAARSLRHVRTRRRPVPPGPEEHGFCGDREYRSAVWNAQSARLEKEIEVRRAARRDLCESVRAHRRRAGRSPAGRGLRVEATWGDFDAEPVGPHSQRMIVSRGSPERRRDPYDRYPASLPSPGFLNGLPQFYPDPPTLAAAAARGRELLSARKTARLGPRFRYRGAESQNGRGARGRTRGRGWRRPPGGTLTDRFSP